MLEIFFKALILSFTSFFSFNTARLILIFTSYNWNSLFCIFELQMLLIITITSCIFLLELVDVFFEDCPECLDDDDWV